MRIRDWSSDVCSSDLQFFEGAVMRRFLLTGGLAAAAMVGLCGPVAAAVTVVASIKPVHSLVAGVMAGAGSPHLIVQGGASPHAISLKPSDATALQEAAVVFWVGEDLEA